MPIELRELIISTEVVDHNTVESKNASTEFTIREKEFLVEECVERVFSMLNKQNER